MTTRRILLSSSIVTLVAAAAVAGVTLNPGGEGGRGPSGGGGAAPPPAVAAKPAPLAPFLEKGVEWLVKAQQEGGGWGAGSHARQDVRDPHAVPADPATTAFAGLALVRAGNTPTSGAYADNVVRALEYMVKTVEASGDGPRITTLEGTQPQTKMGPLVDTALAVQFLSRVVPMLPKEHPLHARADAALDRALSKLGKTQTADGTWGRGGWANVLQGSLGAVAYEMASGAGKSVPEGDLLRARAALQENLDAKTGRAATGGSAGVELYAWAGAARNSASQAHEAAMAVDAAKADGRLPMDAAVTVESLTRAGVEAPQAKALASAYGVARAQTMRLDDETLLQGFGNNGGEEFMSYMMTSEALVMQGGDEWAKWTDKMHGLLSKIQSADGSWTGQHCITSPVFCTAAVVQALTADRDAALLRSRNAPSAPKAPNAAK